MMAGLRWQGGRDVESKCVSRNFGNYARWIGSHSHFFLNEKMDDDDNLRVYVELKHLIMTKCMQL